MTSVRQIDATILKASIQIPTDVKVDSHEVANSFMAIGNDSPERWCGQTFTASKNYTITAVGLLLYRDDLVGEFGTLYASIRNTVAADGGKIPSGADLCVGSIDSNTLTTNVAGNWHVVDLGAGSSLVDDGEYAIVVRVLGGDLNCLVNVHNDVGASYANGNFVWSENSGVDWIAIVEEDADFRTYETVMG